eukprot:scaffold73245_cov61-Phaeocystis_antarctica.AAC.1
MRNCECSDSEAEKKAECSVSVLRRRLGRGRHAGEATRSLGGVDEPCRAPGWVRARARLKVRVRVRVRVRASLRSSVRVRVESICGALVEGALADADAEHAARALLRCELLPLPLRVVERARLLVARLEDRDAWQGTGRTRGQPACRSSAALLTRWVPGSSRGLVTGAVGVLDEVGSAEPIVHEHGRRLRVERGARGLDQPVDRGLVPAPEQRERRCVCFRAPHESRTPRFGMRRRGEGRGAGWRAIRRLHHHATGGGGGGGGGGDRGDGRQ